MDPTGRGLDLKGPPEKGRLSNSSHLTQGGEGPCVPAWAQRGRHLCTFTSLVARKDTVHRVLHTQTFQEHPG